MQWQCRWAPSLGALEDTHQNVWGTKEYETLTDPTVFFGVYGFPDFYSIWKHKGTRAILWAGSDIIHFHNGYWLDDEGKIRLERRPLAKWINENCDNYCENEAEYELLLHMGIESTIIPSFLGQTGDYKVSYQHSDKPKVYLSANEGRQIEYGFQQAEDLAKKNPNVEFHLYGATWEAQNPNVIVHGRVPKEQMNAEIKLMQGGLRLNRFDGFSEVLAKSILWGQYPLARINYPYMLKPEDVGQLVHKTEPNIEGRNHYLSIINKYPWNENNKS